MTTRPANDAQVNNGERMEGDEEEFAVRVS